MVDAVSRLGTSVSKGGVSQKLKQALAQAGFHDAGAPAVFLGAKVLLLIFGIAISIVIILPLGALTPLKVIIILAVGFILSLLPNLVVSLRRKRRCTDVRLRLPDAIDLLEICVSAGMGLDQAWNAVADEVRGVSTILADEMALANLEIHLGAPRPVAMRHMAERTASDELSSLVATMVQSERFGTSISEALRTFATSLREQRSQRAEEAAEKMAVKLLFPLVLCIFPAMLIVVGGPAIMEVLKIISSR
jgi:tight adherence protein C